MKMRLINASAIIERATPDLEEVIEAAGRTCWKSDDKIEPGSAGPFIERIKGFKHDSVLEHGAITVRFIVDRGVSHELVSQESTRYCNYGKDKHGNEATFIDPRPAFPTMDENRFTAWTEAMAAAELMYMTMLQLGGTPQEARAVLPNSVKTEVVMTANPREWRHVFRMRCDKAAHPQMREVMIPLWKEFSDRWPSLFADVEFAQ
jgi:thymidylate synthase (FAD)